ncbi:hypothetical protein BT96DRAFT_1005663 [Gymnopus androsaceus JB14]|uniref:Uncharacterized protein n=1 Tax=Gymnopus androsaceus JB14 TaxID=1447944 RepID=A0A6A4GNH1_9AGAR|nr:hypothetical protein BT96DRAFT_1005663 [Gymnopus androsaceus JB14]
MPLEDPIFATKLEMWTAASLFHFGVDEDIPDDYNWDPVTGALTVKGESLEKVLQFPTGTIFIVDAPLSTQGKEGQNPVADAESILEKAAIPGNFDALSKCMDRTINAQRILHLEAMMGVSQEQTSLSTLLKTHIQFFDEKSIIWSTKPDLNANNVPDG